VLIVTGDGNKRFQLVSEIFQNERVAAYDSDGRLARIGGDCLAYSEKDWEEESAERNGRNIPQRKETVMEILIGIGIGLGVIGAGVGTFKVFGLKLQMPVAKKK